jgi:general stress protein 26
MASAQDPRSESARRRARFDEIIRDFPVAMLVTHGRDGALIARPMSVARVGGDETLYFATAFDSEKVRELEAEPLVLVSFQGKTEHAALSGRATVSRDRALVDDLWNDSWKVYFPRGKDDPDLAIVVVEPERGEYWDQSGLGGLSFLWRAAKAYVGGDEIEPREDDHGRVDLR